MAFDCFASHLVASMPFRRFWIQSLRDIPHQAYRWETPPVSAQNLDRPFEFVAIEDLSLARPASSAAFAEHLHGAPTSHAINFPNLGGDAILVVPTPSRMGSSGNHSAQSATGDAYCHLGDFTRHASEGQQHKFWARVGQTFLKRVAQRPVWLSTAGDGVPWLHVRLDDYPKYYAYSPYRDAPNL